MEVKTIIIIACCIHSVKSYFNSSIMFTNLINLHGNVESITDKMHDSDTFHGLENSYVNGNEFSSFKHSHD